MELERSQVQFGRTCIPYSIRRSARRRTVAVAVEPTGNVLLTAPTDTPVERLDRLVHEKAQWIMGHLREIRAAHSTSAREFASGETVLYLGRQYRLRVLRGAEHVALHRGQLVVCVRGHEPRRPEVVRDLLVRWYRERASRRVPERVRHWAAKVSVEVPKVLIREQRKRWASCDPAGALRVNWRVVQAPVSLLDYVVVHELAHVRHRHHGLQFWSLVGRVLPDYEVRRARLASMGRELSW